MIKIYENNELVGSFHSMEDFIEYAISEAVSLEREACARIAQDKAQQGYENDGHIGGTWAASAAYAIRARKRD